MLSAAKFAGALSVRPRWYPALPALSVRGKRFPGEGSAGSMLGSVAVRTSPTCFGAEL